MDGFATEAAKSAAESIEPDDLDFSRLVEENQAMVYSIALHFFRDRSRAEELAQDVFLQLYRNLHRIESAEHAVRWLRKVTGHRCIDESRRRSWRSSVSLEHLPEPAEQPSEPDFLLRDKLRLLVATLPEKQRLVVILRYQEDLMPEEIAGLLDMPVRTVKSYIQRGLALLREKAGRLLGEMR